MLDWENLKSLAGDQRASFEELCYSIVRRKYGDSGRLSSINDSGGGSGVEFYLTFPDGSKWGWQAKYFYPDSLLSGGGRKTQIKKSLQRSCKDHLNLEKWFLCTPEDFTPREQEWFENKLATSINDGEQVVPDEHAVELVHWGKSEFIAHLSEEKCKGIRKFFFGELELSHSWFERVYTRALQSPAGKRYIAELHTEADVGMSVHRFLGDVVFFDELEQGIKDLKKKRNDFLEKVKYIAHGYPYDIDWNGENVTFAEGVEVADVQTLLDSVVRQISHSVARLRRGEFERARHLEGAEGSINNLSEALEEYEEAVNAFDTENLSYTGNIGTGDEPADERDQEQEAIERAQRKLLEPRHNVTSFLGIAENLLADLRELEETVLHVLGGAATGKTHLAFDVCKSHLESGLPAILLLGQNVSGTKPLRRQLLDLLDVPSQYSWNDFISALEVRANIARGRLPIIIDGLNEAVGEGRLSDVWRKELSSLVDDLRQVRDVVLITTCRTAYVDAIWPEDKPARTVVTRGFGRQTEEAVQKYFDFYKIEAHLSGVLLGQFQHPIYIRIFCEATNPDRDEVKEVYLGEQKLFSVFENYIDECNRAITRRLGRHPSSDLARPALNRLAHRIWITGERRVSFEEAIECIEEKPESEIESWSTSLTHSVEDEGLIVSRSWSGDDEVFSFTYDLMAGYFIANYLIDKFGDDFGRYLNEGEVLTALCAEDFKKRHPLHEDISRCLAALLPEKRGQYLHDLLQSRESLGDRLSEYFRHMTERFGEIIGRYGSAGRFVAGLIQSTGSANLSRADSSDPHIETLFSDSINSLFEIDPKYVSRNAVDLVIDLFDHPGNRAILFDKFGSTWLYPEHPLGAEFIDKRLQGLQMAERDVAWSEHILERRSEAEDVVSSLRKECSSSTTFSKREETRLRLMAIRAMWTLTTTIRPLRDKATEALYWYGRRFPEDFFEQVKRSFQIDDPYVRERMLAAAYGVGMARQYDFESDTFAEVHLPYWSRFLYKTMFSSNAPCHTAHVLMRDYARHLIDMADLHHPELFSKEELTNARPPYDGGDIASWGQADERKDTESGVCPILMDFENYTLGQLVPTRRNYDFEHEEYEKLKAKAYWRIYNLGWRMDRFGEIDHRIQRRQSISRHNQAGKTDRYGKKYSWIAFFELYGHRRDLDAVDEWGPRLPDVDIDPSFPEPPPSIQVINEYWLGSANTETEEWITNGEEPALDPFLVLDMLQQEEGPWVLLSSFFDHDDASRERDLWVRVRATLVSENEVEDILESERVKNIVHKARATPSGHSTFAGEIPWADTFPENEKMEIVEVHDRRRYSIEQQETVASITIAYEASSETPSERRDDQANNAKEAVEEIDLTEMEIEIPVKDTWEIECKTYCNVLFPVWRNAWEGHNEINQGVRGEVPARQVCDALGLVSQPQTFDLYDSEGRRATITTDYRSERDDTKQSQRFLFIRKDLLDQYLEETDQALLVWVVGERQYSVQVFSEKRSDDNVGGPLRVAFSQVRTYPPD